MAFVSDVAPGQLWLAEFNDCFVLILKKPWMPNANSIRYDWYVEALTRHSIQVVSIEDLKERFG